MQFRMPLQAAKQRALDLMHSGNDCGPSVMQVMVETSGYDEELFWAGYALYGGIAGQQKATCGAVAASAVYLGMRHRLLLPGKDQLAQERKNIEKEANGLAKEFMDKFGSNICIELVKLDLSIPENWKKYEEENITAKTCDLFVSFVIEKLYELEAGRK
jgi:C_GCAxxG_C_C family probable redox protein